ncbi:MAG: lysophospholipid acyltransferase family protein [Endomicrobiales bacterium]|nr:lysophospholipid acyltransferase family protein [Endomicrobiales bacterium]
MKRLRHYIEYAALQAFAHAVRLLPLGVARTLALAMADFVFYCVPVRKKVVLFNLKNSFPEMSGAELNSVARRTYGQFAQSMIELIFFPKLTKEKLKEIVKIQGIDVIERAKKNGKGGVLVGAHFGNWELMGAAVAQYCDLTMVVGQQTNILVDNLLNSFRISKGVKIVPLKLALRGVMKTLKENGFIAIVSDQDAHEDGIFVNFMGRPASTPKGPAMFALKTGCPIVMGTIVRDGEGGFTVFFDEIKRPSSPEEEKAIMEYTQNYTNVLEGYVRKYPDHWFWMHRRWKTSATRH